MPSLLTRFVANDIAAASHHALRNNAWLRGEMDFIWDRFFSEVPRSNPVEVEFAGPWRSRLGVITMTEDDGTTYIGINSLLRFPEVPAVITSITLAHELAHYAHGFGSPLPRKYQYPHRGGIVQRELFQRGLRSEFGLYREWIEHYWLKVYNRRIGDTPTSPMLAPSNPPAVNSLA